MNNAVATVFRGWKVDINKYLLDCFEHWTHNSLETVSKFTSWIVLMYYQSGYVPIQEGSTEYTWETLTDNQQLRADAVWSSEQAAIAARFVHFFCFKFCLIRTVESGDWTVTSGDRTVMSGDWTVKSGDWCVSDHVWDSYSLLEEWSLFIVCLCNNWRNK